VKHWKLPTVGGQKSARTGPGLSLAPLKLLEKSSRLLVRHPRPVLAQLKRRRVQD
jgi:hypothetical protein